MSESICVVKLPGDKNFAVISPGRIAYGLNASSNELKNLVREERLEILEHSIVSPEPVAQIQVSLGLIPTMDCNLRCIYCYARGGDTKEIMPFEVAKVAIMNAVKIPGDKLLKLYLVGGGEPLLHFDLVEQLTKYAKSIYRDVELDIVSNGTFGIEVLDWLITNKVNIKISYDGTMQNIQRPFADGTPSSPVVENNIRKLTNSKATVIVQCIVTKHGIQSMRKTVEKALCLGIKAIKFEPALSSTISRSSNDIEPDPHDYANALLDVISYVATQRYDLTIDTGFFGEPSEEYYCGMPTINRVVTPHGAITSCVEVVRPSDPYANLIMAGRIKDGNMVFDEGKKESLRILHYVNQLGGCGSCNLRLICHGGCPMASIWKGGLPIRKSEFTCAVEHTLLPRLLLMIAEDSKVADVVIENASVDRF